MKNIHYDNSNNIHPYVNMGSKLIPASQAESHPLFSEFDSWRRLVSKSAVNSIISQGMEVNFNLTCPHHLQNIYLEIKLQETANVTNSTVHIYNLFEKIEIDYGGQNWRILHPDDRYVGKVLLERSFDEHRKKRYSEGLEADFTPTPNNIPQNGTTTFYVELKLFEFPFDVRQLNNEFFLRFYFNQPAYFVSAGSTSINLSSFNILTRSLDLPLYRYNKPLIHKYVKWVRTMEDRIMNASSYVDIKLNSFHGPSLMLFFVIRNLPINTSVANWTTYITNGIASYELHDRSNDLIAIKHTRDTNRVITYEWDSEYLNQFNNILVLPFSKNPQLDIMTGNVSGCYNFTSDEVLRIDFDSTWVSGNYHVTIYSAEIETFEVNNGNFIYSH